MKISIFIVVLSATLVLSEALALSSMLVGGEHVEKAGRSLCNRRGFVSIVSFGTAVLSTKHIAKADDAETEKTFFRGKVMTSPDVKFPEETSSSALYVTARPNKADNVPRAILDGSNGKPPPVLVARYANPQFPFDFSLTKADLTQEGLSTSESDQFWFEGQDLIVSA
jgi:hypothetical protein